MRVSSRGNPYHDEKGRFASKDGAGMIVENPAEYYAEVTNVRKNGNEKRWDKEKQILHDDDGTAGVSVGTRRIFTKEGCEDYYREALKQTYGEERLDPANVQMLSMIEDDLVKHAGFSREQLEEIEKNHLKSIGSEEQPASGAAVQSDSPKHQYAYPIPDSMYQPDFITEDSTDIQLPEGPGIDVLRQKNYTENEIKAAYKASCLAQNVPRTEGVSLAAGMSEKSFSDVRTCQTRPVVVNGRRCIEARCIDNGFQTYAQAQYVCVDAETMKVIGRSDGEKTYSDETTYFTYDGNTNTLTVDLAKRSETSYKTVTKRELHQGYKDGQAQYRRIGENEETSCTFRLNSLRGSEKQVEWANKLRNEAVLNFCQQVKKQGADKFLSEYREMTGKKWATHSELIKYMVETRFASMINETSAGEIIERGQNDSANLAGRWK